MSLIRRLQPDDFEQAVVVYRDAVISQARGLYSQAQIRAWSECAAEDDQFRQAFLRGYGMASCSDHDERSLEAFALLDPIDRLSLLYCRGRSCRQGRATSLLSALEAHSRRQHVHRLRTEASQLSRPLLERLGWQVEAEEQVIFAGEAFLRWRMIRNLS